MSEQEEKLTIKELMLKIGIVPQNQDKWEVGMIGGNRIFNVGELMSEIKESVQTN